MNCDTLDATALNTYTTDRFQVVGGEVLQSWTTEVVSVWSTYNAIEGTVSMVQTITMNGGKFNDVNPLYGRKIMRDIQLQVRR